MEEIKSIRQSQYMKHTHIQDFMNYMKTKKVMDTQKTLIGLTQMTGDNGRGKYCQSAPTPNSKGQEQTEEGVLLDHPPDLEGQTLENTEENVLKRYIIPGHDLIIKTGINKAMTDEQRAQIRAHFETVGKSCNKDGNMVTEDDITSLRSKKIPTGPNAPCFMACMMKQIGIMDDNGMLQKETLLEMAKAVFNDPEELKLIEDYLHSCSHINGESVSDGAAGCERAMLAYKCMTDNASQFGIEI